MALSNPLTADHVGSGRHPYIPRELGQRLYHCLLMRGMSSSPAVCLTMGVYGQGVPPLSTWKALLTFISLTWCLAGEKTTMGCLDR